MFELRRGRRVLLSTELKKSNASVTTVWSPDSEWLAVTWSDGGAIGLFRTRIFHLEGDRVSEVNVAEKAFRDFQSRHSCPSRGENLQAYQWDAASKAFMLVMSVYPTGDCGRELGHTEAYLVRPTDGEILHHLTAGQLTAYMRSNPLR